MIRIDKTLVSEDLLEEAFVCDLSKCKGACCIEGDSGAPLERSERSILRQELPAIKPFMDQEMVEYAEKYGIDETDSDGELVTKCPGGKACIFAVYKNNTWQCSVEHAYEAGKISFNKPVSCHLYPVRLKEMSHYTAVNYHRWAICSSACDLGKALKVPVYKFLKDALIRKFGSEWYRKLSLVAEEQY